MTRSALALLAVLATAAVAAIVWTRAPAPAASSPRDVPPDVLLLTIDTLRADRLGSYGYSGGREAHD